MGSKRILLGSATIAVIASAALLAPGLASGQMLVPAVTPVSVVQDAPDGDGDGDGIGRAWGHHKDSPDFPGAKGRGHDRPDKPGKDDRTDKPGKGDKADKPGKGDRADKPGKRDKGEGEAGDHPGDGQGKAWGHHKDSADFPGNNGRGHTKDD